MSTEDKPFFTSKEVFEWSQDVIPGTRDSSDAIAHYANQKIAPLIEENKRLREAIKSLLGEVEKEYQPEGLKSPLVRGNRALIKALKALGEGEG